MPILPLVVGGNELCRWYNDIDEDENASPKEQRTTNINIIIWADNANIVIIKESTGTGMTTCTGVHRQGY